MRESDIEKYLIKRVKEAGGTTRKVKWIGKRGCPDRRVMHPYCCVWVELKAPGKDLKPHQLREIERMRAMGEYVVVLDSKAAIDSWIDDI